MKRLLLYLIAFCSMFLNTHSVNSEFGNNPCLAIGMFNYKLPEDWKDVKDSMLIDTCLNSPTYDAIFYKAFGIDFFKIPFVSDTTPVEQLLYIEDFKDSAFVFDDTISYPKQDFKNFEKKFGKIYFKRATNNNYYQKLHKSYFMILDNFFPYDSIIYYLSQIVIVKEIDVYNWPFILNIEDNIEPPIFTIEKQTNENLLIRIRDDSYLKNDKISIFDINGKIVYEKMVDDSKVLNVNITNFPSGIYFIRVRNKTLKFLK